MASKPFPFPYLSMYYWFGLSWVSMKTAYLMVLNQLIVLVLWLSSFYANQYLIIEKPLILPTNYLNYDNNFKFSHCLNTTNTMLETWCIQYSSQYCSCFLVYFQKLNNKIIFSSFPIARYGLGALLKPHIWDLKDKLTLGRTLIFYKIQ